MYTAIFAFAVLFTTITSSVKDSNVRILSVKENKDVDPRDLSEALKPATTEARTGISVATTAMSTFKDVLKVSSSAVKSLPIIGSVIGVVMDLFSIFSTPPNPVGALINYFHKELILDGQKKALHDISVELKLVMDHLRNLKKLTEDDPKFSDHITPMKDSIVRILGKVMTDEFNLHEYSAYVVPKLYALAPIAAIVTEYYEEIDEEDDTACLFAAAIKQYYNPFLFDRLSKITVNDNRADYYANKYKAATMAGFNEPLNVDGWRDLHVAKECFDAKQNVNIDEFYSRGITLIRDEVEKKAFFCKDTREYFVVVRSAINQFFADMYMIVNRSCKKPKESTGELYSLC